MFRRISRTLALLLAAMAAALVMGASPASAGTDGTDGDYPPPEDCSVSVDPDNAEPGDTITISGENWTPGSTVTILFGEKEIGQDTVEEDGTWSFDYTIPEDTGPGEYSVTGEGCDGEDVQGTTITVAAAPAALPATGSSTTEPLVRTGAVLIAAGAVLVYAVRRRQQAAAS